MGWLGCSGQASKNHIKNGLVGIKMAFQKMKTKLRGCKF
jgi:hypothetical protein